MLIGVCRSDLLDGRGTPVPIGALDYDVWSHESEDWLASHWAACRARFEPDGDYYEYREVDVSIADDQVMEAFATRELNGAVESSAAGAGAELAHAVDRFYRDLGYTAPEMVGQRLNELGARVAEPMGVFGYPRSTEAPSVDERASRWFSELQELRAAASARSAGEGRA